MVCGLATGRWRSFPCQTPLPWARRFNALGRCTTGVAHPRQDEWGTQAHRSLDPIFKLAGLRSWRAFVRDAVLVTVATETTGSVTVSPNERDADRADGFYPILERSRELSDRSPEAIGSAVLSSAERSS
jgi:hypothetical protein